MSKIDREFVRTLDVSYAKVAQTLGISRQAVSRGVHSEDGNYFSSADLTKLLVTYEESDPIRYQIARKSLAELYPDLADEIFHLIDARAGANFDPAVPGEFTFVTADFFAFMGTLKRCREQIETIINNLKLNPGSISFVVSANDFDQVNSYIDSLEDIGNKKTRVTASQCEADLTPFPSCLMRIGANFEVNIFIASDHGFVPLPTSETIRIKNNLSRISTVH